MEKLTVRDWSFIARCLEKDASDADLAEFKQLLVRHPGLQRTIENLQGSANPGAPEFDAIRAFAKLDERLKKENLI